MPAEERANGATPPPRAGRVVRPPADRRAAPNAILPLAHGPLTEREVAELGALLGYVENRTGLACASYKERCMRRRVAVRMRACGVHDYAAYQRLLEGQPEELERLLNAVTINVSKFLRNPEVWKVLRDAVVPELAVVRGEVRLWSAGTAAGEEAYSLAMLVEESAGSLEPQRCRILATDVDRGALAAAASGTYAEYAMGDLDAGRRRRWFGGPDQRTVDEQLHARVRFRPLDLLRDPFPREQHLILCRNVIIYFERRVQEDLFRRLHAALAPGGFLVLGKVEALFGSATGLFSPVAPRERVYRRT
ncbi:MAG: protein-glutamate O-methyltransferase CheR [Gemmatimonadota bacterium]